MSDMFPISDLLLQQGELLLQIIPPFLLEHVEQIGCPAQATRGLDIGLIGEDAFDLFAKLLFKSLLIALHGHLDELLSHTRI